MLLKLSILTIILGLTYGRLSEEELFIFLSMGMEITDHSNEFWLFEHSGVRSWGFPKPG